MASVAGTVSRGEPDFAGRPIEFEDTRMRNLTFLARPIRQHKNRARKKPARHLLFNPVGRDLSFPDSKTFRVGF